jgi:heme exporter protein A
MGVIEVKRLTRRFGLRTVLNGLELTVQAGEFVALLGPNGAGKTTLLRILASLTRPTMGRVALAGYELPRQAAEARQCLGFVSHLPLLYGNLSAEQNLWFYGQLYGVQDYRRRASEVLSLVGLDRRSGDAVRTFSRGMQQRLAVARAILHDPQVLLLDEPHTGLDQDACAMLDAVLQRITKQGRTVLMTSHDLVRIQTLADRFDVLSRGRICASVSAAQLGKGDLLEFYRSSLENDR